MTPEEEAKMREILGGRVTRMPLSLNALQVFAKRYLLKTLDGSVIETPEEMFERVARALADVERRYGASDEQVDAYAREFYDAMFSMRFTPAGRTLANAGGPTRTVSNCIVLHIEDSMEGIMQTLYNAALLQKDGSGLGFPLHLMRPAGAVTRASFGTSSGPVSFLHVYNTAFGVIKQQNRNGANMAVMSVEHPDILEFIYCKKVEGSIRNFNISVGLTDRFMEAVHGDDAAPWYCEFNGERMLPRRIVRDANFSIVSITPVEMTAAQLFAEIVDCAWSNGEPGCVFLDTVNHTNPLPGLGRIESCNPCGEQFLAKNDVCNLGSINLESFVRPTTTSDATDATDATGNDTTMEVDVEALRRVTRTAVRMLDNVIDMSEFSVEDVQRTSRDNRRIGLGIMGFADLLYQLEIGYDTDEGRRTAELVMSTITEAAHQMSQELAAEKGTFANYDKSVYAGRGVPMRNCALTTVAPTGTISMIFDVSGGVEPYFALAYYYKGILGGNVQLQVRTRRHSMHRCLTHVPTPHLSSSH
jgi:ribonucleoside-diphosphate reductase alpha chain